MLPVERPLRRELENQDTDGARFREQRQSRDRAGTWLAARVPRQLRGFRQVDGGRGGERVLRRPARVDGIRARPRTFRIGAGGESSCSPAPSSEAKVSRGVRCSGFQDRFPDHQLGDVAARVHGPELPGDGVQAGQRAHRGPQPCLAVAQRRLGILPPHDLAVQRFDFLRQGDEPVHRVQRGEAQQDHASAFRGDRARAAAEPGVWRSEGLAMEPGTGLVLRAQMCRDSSPLIEQIAEIAPAQVATGRQRLCRGGVDEHDPSVARKKQQPFRQRLGDGVEIEQHLQGRTYSRPSAARDSPDGRRYTTIRQPSSPRAIAFSMPTFA